MQIVNIEKLKNKYRLYLSNGKSLFISENTLIKFGLVKKIDLTPTMLKEIIQAENKEGAFNRALYYLNFGLRSEYEIRKYLLEKEFLEEYIDYALEKLKEYKYINDDYYAEVVTRDYFTLKRKGPSWIRRKLQEKHIDSEYIEKHIANICTEESNYDNVYYLIEKEFSKKNEPQKKKFQKITTKLNTNGYSFDIIRTAFDNFLVDYHEEENDNSLIEKYYDKAYKKFSKKYEGYTLKQKIIDRLLRDGFAYDDIKNYFLEIDF